MQEKFEQFMELYEELKEHIRRNNKWGYERWKAGGFLIDNDILSMYPTLEKVLDFEEDEEEDEEETNEEE